MVAKKLTDFSRSKKWLKLSEFTRHGKEFWCGVVRTQMSATYHATFVSKTLTSSLPVSTISPKPHSIAELSEWRFIFNWFIFMLMSI